MPIGRQALSQNIWVGGGEISSRSRQKRFRQAECQPTKAGIVGDIVWAAS